MICNEMKAKGNFFTSNGGRRVCLSTKAAHEVLGTNWPPLDDKGVMKRGCKNEKYFFVDFFAHLIGMLIMKREEKKEEIS